MDNYKLQIFVLNWVLVIIDAGFGYYLAPMMAPLRKEEPDGVVRGPQFIRKLLIIVVTLYMFFNCLAYFRGSAGYLLAVTCIVVLDIGFQIAMKLKLKNNKGT